MCLQEGLATDQTALDALTQGIDERRKALRPVNAALVGRLRALVAGAELDFNRPLPPELDDAGMF